MINRAKVAKVTFVVQILAQYRERYKSYSSCTNLEFRRKYQLNSENFNLEWVGKHFLNLRNISPNNENIVRFLKKIEAKLRKTEISRADYFRWTGFRSRLLVVTNRTWLSSLTTRPIANWSLVWTRFILLCSCASCERTKIAGRLSYSGVLPSYRANIWNCGLKTVMDLWKIFVIPKTTLLVFQLSIYQVTLHLHVKDTDSNFS